jgi:NAD(P)-dependent dehydrogenase (short-subunit alcohol dehydrogenase family)
MPSVIITGASSGIGQASVLWFLAQGWSVVATMRQPANSPFTPQANLHVVACDVTQPDSISSCITQALSIVGSLDVVVNNAGYGLLGPLELATPAQIRQQFDTNVFGLIGVIQAVLPTFRQQGHGRFINVASIGGRTTFPLYSLYHGTKWAVEGLSESLAYELAPLGIQVKIIEPGPIRTAFYDRSQQVTGPDESAWTTSPYAALCHKVFPQLKAFGAKAPGPEVVARQIGLAATDEDKGRLRYPVNTMGSLWLRRLLPERLYRSILRRMVNAG